MILIVFALNILAALFFLDYVKSKRISAKDRNGSRKSTKRLNGPVDSFLKKAGICSLADKVFYVYVPVLAIAAGIPLTILWDTAGGIIILIFPSLASVLMLKSRKKRYDSVFQKNAYRIYKYITNQTNAGLRPSDALRSMHEVIEDKALAEVFVAACAEYSVTYDNGRLADSITENIDTPESRNFAMSIRDGLFESRNTDLMERLEQMMFNRYFAYIQRLTDSLKTRCLVTVILLCAVVVCMVLIPTVMEVQDALDSIFT